jgi:hypothetical protein
MNAKLGYNRDTCRPKFISALFITAKVWRQPSCSTIDEWIRKIIYIMEFYSAIRKNDIMWFGYKWMQLEDIMLSEVRQRL